jgi:hypothetical protein
MPKTNQGGATAAGMQGVVEHGAPLADGRTLSELDPERNLDGTLIEGEHPDHADGEKRETAPLSATDPEPQPIDEPAGEPAREEESSPGNSSAARNAKTSSTKGTTGNRR